MAVAAAHARVRALKLLLYVDHFRLSGEGAENDAVKTARGLAERGHDVHVACRDGQECAGLKVYANATETEELRQDLDADIFLDWTFTQFADVYRLGGGVHREFLTCAEHSYGHLGRLFKRMKSRTGKEKRLLARQDRILAQPDARYLAISERVAGELRRQGARPESVQVLYNGVENELYDAAARNVDRLSFRWQWGLGDEDLACLWVAHNLRLKNIALAADICGRLRREGLPVFLIVVGRRAPRLRRSWLHYAGHVTDMARCYLGSDLLLHPTFYDAFGNVVLEAMSASLPVLVSDCAGASELIGNDRNGKVLPAQGIVRHLWAQAVRDLAHHPERRQAWGAAARQTALAHPFGQYLDGLESALIAAARFRGRQVDPPGRVTLAPTEATQVEGEMPPVTDAPATEAPEASAAADSPDSSPGDTPPSPADTAAPPPSDRSGPEAAP